jgi:hypothetical protein
LYKAIDARQIDTVDMLEKNPARRYYLRLLRWRATFFLTIWISGRQF